MPIHGTIGCLTGTVGNAVGDLTVGNDLYVAGDISVSGSVDMPNLRLTGDLQVDGGDIKGSDGSIAIKLTGDEALFIGDVYTGEGLFVSGNLKVGGVLTGDLTIGSDADGTDRKVTFGHATLKTSIGIDDSADVFAINTDANFESGNDLEIDASGNVTIGNGDLKVAGGDIYGPTDAQLRIRSDAHVVVQIDADGDGTNKFVIWDNGENPKFEVDESGNVQMDGSVTIGGNIIKASDGGSTITLDTSDNVTIGNDLEVTGGDIVLGSDADGSDRTIVFSHATLKTRMGIDDSEDLFVINTDASFEGTSTNNSLTIDASHNLGIAGDLTIGGNDIKNADGETTITMDADQRVGIGGIAPSYKLDVNGDIRVRGNDIRDNSGNPAITFDGSANTQILQDLTVGAGTAADRKILFDGNAQDYHVGLDDSADSLVIGHGSSVGSSTALIINSGSMVRMPKGMAYSPAVLVSDSHSGNSLDKWLKIATGYIDEVGSTANTLGATFLVNFRGIGSSNWYDMGDHSFIINAQFSHNQSSPYFQSYGTQVTVEPLSAARIPNTWRPLDNVIMTHTGQSGTQTVELWIRPGIRNADCHVTYLGGYDNVGNESYDPNTEPYNWFIHDQMSWEDSFHSLGTNHYANWASKDFNSVYTSGSLGVSGSLSLASGASVNAIKDEDNMSSNSATALATQQSIKAYVDANAGSTYSAGTGLDLSGTTFSVDVSDFMTNGTNNRVVTATGADAMNAESGLTYDGTSLTVDNRIDIAGTLPTLQIGDGGDEDIKLLFNSDTNDYYIGSDATDDKLHIGVGSTIGTNSAMVINSGSFVEFPKGLRHSPSVWVGTTANDSSAQNRFMKIAEHTVGLSPSAYASANAVLLVTMCGLGHTGYDIFQTWMVVVQWGESNNTVTSGAPATKISARLLDSSESDELAMDPSFFTLTYNGTTEAAVWVKSPYGYIDISITHLGGSPSRVGGDVAIGTTSGAAAGWVLCDSTGDQDDWQTSITSLGADLVADYASQHVNEMMVEGSLLVSGSATIHTLTLTNTQDADQTDSSIPALRIGNVAGQHIQFDDNEIHAKSDATTGGPLYLQHNGGGSLSIGGGSISYGLVSIKAKGDTSSDGLAVYGNTSTNTIRIWTDASGNRRISGGSGDTGTIYINNTGGDLVVGDDLFVKGTSSSNQTDLRINTSTGALYHYSSTRKVKSNIQNHDVGLNEIIQLQPVIYERNSEPGVSEVGLIAEDVRSALGDDYVILGPDYTYDENGDYVWEDDTEGTAEGAPMGRKKKLDSEDTVPHDWDYRSVVTALIGAVKDLKEENDSLKARIEALES